jgi:hypothetical protein
LKRFQFIGSVNIDSLFIAKTRDIVRGEEMRFPDESNKGAEALNTASSRNCDGRSSCLGIRHTNLVGAFDSKDSDNISSRPSICI